MSIKKPHRPPVGPFPSTSTGSGTGTSASTSTNTGISASTATTTTTTTTDDYANNDMRNFDSKHNELCDENTQ